MTQWENEKKEIIRIDNERKLAPKKGRKRNDDVRDEESRITDPEYPDGPVTTSSKRSRAKRKRCREEEMREEEGVEEKDEEIGNRQEEKDIENDIDNEDDVEDKEEEDEEEENEKIREDNDDRENENEINDDAKKNKKRRRRSKYDISKLIEKDSSKPSDYIAKNWHSQAVMNAALKKPSELPLFNWEHVLYAVQDYADSMQKINSVDISVRFFRIAIFVQDYLLLLVF